MFKKIFIVEDTLSDVDDLTDFLSLSVSRDSIVKCYNIENAFEIISKQIIKNESYVVFIGIFWTKEPHGLYLAQRIRYNFPTIKLVAFTGGGIQLSLLPENSHLFNAVIDKNTISPNPNSLSIVDITTDFLLAIEKDYPVSNIGYSCFISYCEKDSAFVKRLYIDLKERGILCWYAPNDMKIGERIREGIDKAIEKTEKVLIILSVNSIESLWVEKEVETAFEKESKLKSSVLFPIMIDKTIMKTDKAWASDIRRQRHIGDFTQWKNQNNYLISLKRLVDNIKNK